MENSNLLFAGGGISSRTNFPGKGRKKRGPFDSALAAINSGQKVTMRGADGLDHQLMLVCSRRSVAYCCAPKDYEEAITRPEACIEVGFPLRDVKMKEAAN